VRRRRCRAPWRTLKLLYNLANTVSGDAQYVAMFCPTFRDSMHSSTSPARLRLFLVAILIAALVSSHWHGLVHRIDHASRMLSGAEYGQLSTVAQAGVGAIVASGDSAVAPLPLDQAAGHSCLAFDDATIGACLGTSPFVIKVPLHAPVLAAWLAFISYLAPFTAHFSSRAPPQS
jgi:hypothetical protein